MCSMPKPAPSATSSIISRMMTSKSLTYKTCLMLSILQDRGIYDIEAEEGASLLADCAGATLCLLEIQFLSKTFHTLKNACLYSALAITEVLSIGRFSGFQRAGCRSFQCLHQTVPSKHHTA